MAGVMQEGDRNLYGTRFVREHWWCLNQVIHCSQGHTLFSAEVMSGGNHAARAASDWAWCGHKELQLQMTHIPKMFFKVCIWTIFDEHPGDSD